MKLQTFFLFIFSFSATAVLADYWSDYRTCLSGSSNADIARCATFISTRQNKAVTGLTKSLAGLASSVQCTDSATNTLFLGNGLKIDLVTCGERGSGVAGCTSNFGPGNPEDIVSNCVSPVPASTDGGAVLEWCADCAPGGSGCAACGSRGSMVQEASRSITKAVDKMLTCFGTGGKWPSPKLKSKIIRTYTDLASQGTTLSCPNQDIAKARLGEFTAGRANLAERTIKIFPAGMGDTATFGHEFLHMCSGVDNQDGQTHNHPHTNRRHNGSGSGSGSSFNPSTTINPNGLTNEYFDRVYSCESLCFEKELISKEQCELCLEYGETSATEKTKRRKPCKNMLTRAQLGELKKLKRYADSEVKDMCRSQTNTMLGAIDRSMVTARSNTTGASFRVEDVYYANFRPGGSFRSSISPFPDSNRQSPSLVGEKTPEEVDATAAGGGPVSFSSYAPTWGTISSRCEGALENVLEQIESMITTETARGTDLKKNRNLAELKNMQRQYEMEKRLYSMKKTCHSLKIYKHAQSACYETAMRANDPKNAKSICNAHFVLKGGLHVSQITGGIETLKTRVTAWNEFASGNSETTISATQDPYDTTVYTPHSLPSVTIYIERALKVCDQIPAIPTTIISITGSSN